MKVTHAFNIILNWGETHKHLQWWCNLFIHFIYTHIYDMKKMMYVYISWKMKEKKSN